MRLGRIGVAALGLAGLGVAGWGSCAFAGADTEPVIVVPGRPDIPIMIDGRDVRGAIIEGEWGLARGHTGITIIPGPWLPGYRGGGADWRHGARGFYPGTGKPPAYGRLEVIPPPGRARHPAEGYTRSWEAESPRLPATISPYPEPPSRGPRRGFDRQGY
jgi:hypothetical protein